MKCKKQERVLQADYRKSCRQELAGSAGRLPDILQVRTVMFPQLPGRRET